MGAVASIEICAAPDHNRRTLALGNLFPIACIVQRVTRRFERQPLSRFGPLHRPIFEAKAFRVKRRQLAQKAAAIALDAVWAAIIRVVNHVYIPSFGRCFAQPLNFVDDVVPKGIHVWRIWENASHTDECDVVCHRKKVAS